MITDSEEKHPQFSRPDILRQHLKQHRGETSKNTNIKIIMLLALIIVILIDDEIIFHSFTFALGTKLLWIDNFWEKRKYLFCPISADKCIQLFWLMEKHLSQLTTTTSNFRPTSYWYWSHCNGDEDAEHQDGDGDGGDDDGDGYDADGDSCQVDYCATTKSSFLPLMTLICYNILLLLLFYWHST